MPSIESVKDRALPKTPGCYLFTDKNGYAIYIGKAKNLHNRVRSYFTKAAAVEKRTAGLVSLMAGVEWVETGSELDALLLEFRLIKYYKPMFNAQLKPDLNRPYLRVSDDAPYPTVTISAKLLEDGASYFDFFSDDYDAMDAIAIIGKAWGLPQCRQKDFSAKRSPCPYSSLDGCMSPCSHAPAPAEYAAAINGLLAFMDGDSSKFQSLEAEMYSLADAMEYEKAAGVKQLIDGLERLQFKSRRRFHIPNNGEVLVLIRPYREPAFSAFYIAKGVVMDRTDFPADADTSLFREYARQLTGLDKPLPGGEWLPYCLTEVIAHKEIILLKGRGHVRAVTAALKGFASA